MRRRKESNTDLFCCSRTRLVEMALNRACILHFWLRLLTFVCCCCCCCCSFTFDSRFLLLIINRGMSLNALLFLSLTWILNCNYRNYNAILNWWSITVKALQYLPFVGEEWPGNKPRCLAEVFCCCCNFLSIFDRLYWIVKISCFYKALFGLFISSCICLYRVHDRGNDIRFDRDLIILAMNVIPTHAVNIFWWWFIYFYNFFFFVIFRRQSGALSSWDKV